MYALILVVEFEIGAAFRAVAADHGKLVLVERTLCTLKELTAEYVALKGQLDAYKPDLAELKSKLTDLKHIRYNYKILIRDTPQTDQYHRKGDRIVR